MEQPNPARRPATRPGALDRIMPFQLVIFDCDGVLFDSREANAAFFNHLRACLNLGPLTETEVDLVHVSTTDEAIERLIPAEHYHQAWSLRQTIDYRQFNRFMRVSPHLTDLLGFLKSRCKTAVCTNRGHSVHHVLRDFGLTDYFDLVVSCRDVSQSKPHPESVLLILEKLKVPAHEAIFIGDSEIDARAARAAGVKLAAYRNPELIADVHIDDMLEMKTVLGG